jgi:RNA polymerase sigma-70 factor (ECF subfamily)
MNGPDQQLEPLLTAAARGESSAMAVLVDAIQPALLQFVARRLDPRLAARIDPADVVQNVLLLASRHIVQFLECRSIPFSFWLNQIALEQIAYVHRIHIRSKKRTVCRESPRRWIDDRYTAFASTEDAVAHEPSASASVEAAEQRVHLHQRIQDLPEEEQKLLHLRFFERLGVKLVAEELGVTVAAVRMRQFRALRHLRALIAADYVER